MKKITILSAVLAAGLLLSCNKEVHEIENTDLSVPSGMKEVTITANVDESVTKTTYSDAGVFSWTKGDKISVMGTDYNFYTFTAREAGASSTFTGYVPEGVDIRKEAFYPADSGHKRVEGNYFFSIPEYKDMSESFSADLPMGSYSSAGVYTFRHITGAALLTFTNFPENIVSAEISISNQSLKLSGSFGVWTSDGLWTNGVAAASTVSEGRFVRKVPVKNSQAQVYLPYASNGNLWADCNIDIIGYDASGKEFKLLMEKVMQGNSTAFPRGTVVPYVPLELPDYIPEVEWTSVDWNGANVDVPSVEGFDDVRLVADQYYLYLRIKAHKTFSWDTFYYYMGRGEGSDALSWAWTTTADKVYGGETAVTADSFSVKYNKAVAETNIQKEGDYIYWYVAFPRNAHEITSQAGNIYFSFMGYVNGGFAGAAPVRWGEALSITLP